MNSIEGRVKEVFDAVILPPGLSDTTLAFIESKRRTGRHKRPQEARRLSFLAAAALLFVALGLAAFGVYGTQTALVGIEVNPSLELGVNRFNMVIFAKALNEDGQRVLSEVDLVGRPYDEALMRITESGSFSAFFGDDSFMDISIVCKDDRQAQTLIALSDSRLAGLPIQGFCGRVSQERHDEALRAGMGVQRFEAACILMDLDPSMTLDGCRHMSMRELSDRILEIEPDNEYIKDHLKGRHQQEGDHNHSGQDRQGQEQEGRQGQSQNSQQGHQGQQGMGYKATKAGTGLCPKSSPALRTLRVRA